MEGVTILIAEDEKDLRELLKLNLEEEGYHVICAGNGREALQLFASHNISLGIFDIMMPVLDGFNLLRQLRETSDVPVILLTARGEEMDKVLGFGLGADDYLVKPFSMTELIVRVAARLRRSRENSMRRSSSVLTIGEITLDTASWSAYKRGTAIELNAKELQLLKFFMENPERVYTKKQLYQAVWEDDYYDDDNTIMVHISHLRSKIEDNPREPAYIRTMKGIGYKFCRGNGK